MSARHLSYDLTSEQAYQEVMFTIAALTSSPYGTQFLPYFQSMLQRCKTIRETRLDMEGAITIARAQMTSCDAALESTIDLVDKIILLITNDRASALYKLFFKNPPSQMKRPVLGAQLEAQRGWLSLLEGQNIPEKLKELKPRLTTQIQAADQATLAKKSAEKKLEEFLTVGEWKKFIDDLNKIRIDTYSALDKIVVDNPDATLGRSFAKTFFLQVRNSYAQLDLDEELSLTHEELEEARSRVNVLEARYVELRQRKDSQERQEQERQEKLSQITELERQLDLLRAELAKR